MNTEIMNIFRSVLKEELDPVHKRLGVIEQNVKEIKTGQKKLENDVSELKNDVNGLKTGQKKLENDFGELNAGQKKLENDFSELKGGQKKLENDFSQLDQAVRELSAEQKEGHKCVIRYLEDYSEKITNHFDNKTDALNKRVFTVETEIERLIKQ